MSMRETWNIPEFRRFLIGDGINTIGNSIFIVGMSWTVAQIGGPKIYGLIFTAYFLGHLPLLVFGGMVVDRFPRRTVALIADLAEAGIISIATIILFMGSPVIDTLLVTAFAVGGASAFSMPAVNALIPDLVEDKLLAQASSIRGISITAAWALGLIIGSLLVGKWGIEICLAIDVITFLISAFILFTITEIPIRREEETSSMKEELLEAIRFVKTQPWLFAGLVIAMIWHLGDSAIEIGVPFIIEQKGIEMNIGMEGKALMFGIFGAIGAVGAMIGSAIGGIYPIPKKHRGLVFYILIGTIAWSMLMWAMPIPYWLILIFVILEGIMGGSLMVIWRTSMSDSVDQYLRGRVNSLDSIGSLIFIPLSPLLGGWLIEETNVLFTYMVAVSIMILVTTVGIIVPSFRKFERIESGLFPIVE
jgi:MFS family permease